MEEIIWIRFKSYHTIFGIRFEYILKHRKRNKFWKDVLQRWIQIYKENYVISYQITTYDISHILQMTKKHSFLKNILIMGKDRLLTYVMQMVVTFLFMIFQLFFQRKIKFCSIYIWQICYLKNYDSKYPTTVIFFMNSNKGCKEM